MNQILPLILKETPHYKRKTFTNSESLQNKNESVKGRTIIFLMGGGGTIFQRFGHNIFLNFSSSKQFFSQILVRQTIYFFNLPEVKQFFHGLFSYLWN